MYVDRFKLFWLIRPNFRLAHEVLQKFDVTKTKTIYFWRDISNISGIFSLKKKQKQNTLSQRDLRTGRYFINKTFREKQTYA